MLMASSIQPLRLPVAVLAESLVPLTLPASPLRLVECVLCELAAFDASAEDQVAGITVVRVFAPDGRASFQPGWSNDGSVNRAPPLSTRSLLSAKISG